MEKTEMFMQQKIVVKVSMNSDKQTHKALKIAVSISGVESASFVGSYKDQMAVTGEAIDSIELTTILTKRIGYTEELLSVGLVEESKPPIEAPMQVDPYHYIMKCSKM
ncbi:putative heavy metal-associated isoprenylated plant protein/47 [Helianthus annuus]|nr:putative heavy metal-associated isoprenylated plant protein/47 [Helianthus annuus]